MKLISESIEDVDYLIEDDDAGKKNYKIRGPFLQAEIKNRNGRIYPMHILEKEVGRYNTEYIQKNRAFGELGHPDGPTVNLERVSHMILICILMELISSVRQRSWILRMVKL